MKTYEQAIRRLHEDLGIPSAFRENCRIPLQPEAAELVSIGDDMFGRRQHLAPGAAEHWREMRSAAARSGIDLQVVSAFRSVDYQCKLIKAKLDRGETIDEILRVNAAPGFSEHHTGCALDLNTTNCEPLSETFEKTAAFDWLTNQAHVFGFRLSFPRGNPWGIVYEPWHWSYRP